MKNIFLYKWQVYIVGIIPLLLIFFFRDFTPANELRYLSIADEAINQGHFFAFYYHGLPYTDKPPLYIWLVMLSRLVGVEQNMLDLGIFSVLPAFIVIYIMSRWIKNEVLEKYMLCGQYMLISTAYFIGAALVIRMDMFMCMFIILSLYIFYKTYQDPGYRKGFWLFPLCMFVGLFIKGPLALIFPIVSIIAFLIVVRRPNYILKYLGWRLWIILFIFSGIWIFMAWMEGGDLYIHDLLVKQTLHRAVNAFHHQKPFYYYFMVIFYVLAPWILFYISIIYLGIKRHLVDTDLKKFFLTVIVVVFVILSFISSKVDIYMLPLIPFVTFFSILILPDVSHNKAIRWSLYIPFVIVSFAFPVYLVMSYYNNFLHDYVLYLAVAVLSASSFLSIMFLRNHKMIKSIECFSIGLFICLFIGSFSLPRLNGYIGYRELANKIEAVSSKNKITTTYTYRLKNGGDIRVYTNHPIIMLDESTIGNVDIKDGKSLLVFPLKYIKHDSLLISKIEGGRMIRVGNNAILLFDN